MKGRRGCFVFFEMAEGAVFRPALFLFDKIIYRRTEQGAGDSLLFEMPEMNIEARYLKEATSYAEQIKSLRKMAGLNQQQFGAKTSLTQSQISLIETGNSNFEFVTLVKLANGLKVEIADLFNYDRSKKFKKITKTQEINKRTKIEREKFSIRLKRLIQHRDIKQDALAVLSSIDEGDLSRFINGEHNIEFFNLIKLAEGLKVELIDLFNYNGPLPENNNFKRIGKNK